jgi:hypothetical protein
MVDSKLTLVFLYGVGNQAVHLSIFDQLFGFGRFGVRLAGWG